MSADPASPERARRPGGRTERHTRAILTCVLDLLEAKGYAAFSFNELAEASGVNRSTLYRRWPNRAVLVLDAIDESLVEEIVPPDTGSLIGDLRGTLQQIGAYISSPLGAAVLVAGLEIGTADPSRAQRWVKRLGDFDAMFERGVARGEIPKSFDREAALAVASGGLYFRKITAATEIDDAWIDRICLIWRRLMKA